MKATPFSEPVTYHGEGAVWSEWWGGLRCLDMLAGDILHFDSAGGSVRHHLGPTVAMIRPVRAGLSVVARHDDVILWDEVAGSHDVIAAGLAPAGTRLNEGTCAPDGSLLIGSMSEGGRAAAGRLWQLTRRGRRVVASAVTVSNGIGFSPDGSRAYYVDSATYRIDVFSVTDDGVLVDRRPLARVDPRDGAPDGLCVDAAGGIWVALYGGGAVRRYRPDGGVDGAVSVAARQVTSCAFGGPDLRTLYITTSRENLDPDDDPLAGSVFSFRPAVTGMSTTPYRIAESCPDQPA